MSKVTTFKQIVSEYDRDTLQAITEQGCISGCCSDLIYYQDTNAYYDKFASELHDVLGDWIDEIGETPTFIVKELGNACSFKNAMVWFVAELYANDILDTMKCELED